MLGGNSLGELGDGTKTYSSTPVGVVGLGSGVVAVTAGVYHACAVTAGGAAKCWGSNGFGALGDGTATLSSTTPVSVVGMGSGVKAVTAFYNDTCAVTAGATAYCWGGNANGQLGNGTTTDSSTPVKVIGLGTGAAAVSVGGASGKSVGHGVAG